MSLGNHFGLIISIAVPCFLVFLVFRSGYKYDDFKKNGIKTEAKILNIKQVSTSGTGSPKCIFTLFFTTEDGKEVTVLKKQVVSVTKIIPLERERKVFIYYKKEDPRKVWIILR